MPTYGEAFDWKECQRIRDKITAELKAKGLVEGTNKFGEVFSRKFKKAYPYSSGY